MGLIRVQSDFLGPGRYGWSERYYLVGVTTLGSPATLRMKAFRVQRQLLLGRGIVDNGVTMHDEDVPGSRLSFPPSDLPAGQNAYNLNFSIYPADYAWSDLLVSADLADQTTEGRFFLGGVPDYVNVTTDRVPSDAIFNTFWEQFEGVAQNGSYGSKILDKSLSPLLKITAFSITPPSLIFRFTIPGHGLSTGNKVKYYKMFGKTVIATKQRNYAGTSTVTVWDVNTISLDNFYTTDTFTLTRPGSIRNPIYKVSPWQDIFIERVVDKKRGVGRLPPRGRVRIQGPRA